MFELLVSFLIMVINIRTLITGCLIYRVGCLIGGCLIYRGLTVFNKIKKLKPCITL